MRYQVPVKYWYNWVRGALEAEMNFIEVIVQKNDRVIDIGGNRGIYAYELWRRGALVEVFEPNPYLEELVSLETGVYRSIEVFNLRAPKKDQVFESGEEIVFSWNGQSNSGFSLKILNNDGKQIVKFQTPGTEFQYANTLTAGLYYWKVEAGSNILMNRFYVK